MNNRKTNRKIITIMLTMIISVSSCFSAYCAETPAAEAASTVPVQAGIADEAEAAEAAAIGASEEEPSGKAIEDAAEEIILEEETEEQAYTPQDKKTSDELFAGYVDAEFGITDDVSGKKLLQKRRATAGSRLTGDTLAAYNYISSQLPLIAAGEITSTHFTVPDEEVSFISETAWTAEELGVPAIEENNAIRQDAKEAASKKLRQEYFDLSILIDALLADHPYLLYWYDKTPKTTADGYVYRAFKITRSLPLTGRRYAI